MLNLHRPIGDVRRSSLTQQHPTLRFFPQTAAITNDTYDQWHCVESQALNELLIALCRSWRHTNSPIVTSQPRPCPLVKHITFDDDCTFKFDDSGKTLTSLRDYVRHRGTRPSVGALGGSTLVDNDDVRKSREIQSSGIIEVHDKELRKCVARLMRTYWGLERCSMHLYKISLYEENNSVICDHFDFHRDALHDVNHVATLEVALESPDLEGGQLNYRDFHHDPERDAKTEALLSQGGRVHYLEDEEEVMKLGEYRASDTLKLHLFYTDTEHSIEPVTNGFRISLEYEIIKKTSDNDDRRGSSDGFSSDEDSEYLGLSTLFTELGNVPPSTSIFEAMPMDLRAVELIVKHLSSSQNRTPALLMSHLYPLGSCDDELNTSNILLRGYDRLLYDALVPYFHIELVAVCMWSQESGDGSVTHCVTLPRRHHHRHHKRQFTLYITPTVVNCMDSLAGAYLDNCDEGESEQLNYTTVAMTLNKKS